MSSYSPPSPCAEESSRLMDSLSLMGASVRVNPRWLFLITAVFLVAVPVFFQAPLVRSLPWISLAMSGIWLVGGWWLMRQHATHLWGDLLIGFGWTWLAGSVYWGWFRWEPIIHLPIEAIALPIVLWGISQQRGLLGHYFYLGSLLGTALTDLYFYWVDLMPYWRGLMRVDLEYAPAILHQALLQLQNPTSVGRALVLLAILVGVGVFPMMACRQLHWWVFSGAILSTILVDALFFLVALAA